MCSEFAKGFCPRGEKCNHWHGDGEPAHGAARSSGGTEEPAKDLPDDILIWQFEEVKSQHGGRAEELRAEMQRRGYVDGDWNCRSCRFLNYRKRGICKNCGKPKNDGPSGEWRCACGYHNFGSRWHCKQCHASAPPGVIEAGNATQPGRGAGPDSGYGRPHDDDGRERDSSRGRGDGARRERGRGRSRSRDRDRDRRSRGGYRDERSRSRDRRRGGRSRSWDRGRERRSRNRDRDRQRRSRSRNGDRRRRSRSRGADPDYGRQEEDVDMATAFFDGTKWVTMSVCPFWKQGTCQKGSKCKYPHA